MTYCTSTAVYTCTCMYMYTCTLYMYVCWQLLSNQKFIGPYLEAEVVEEIMGWLG